MRVLLICLLLAQNVNTNTNQQDRADQEAQSSPVQSVSPSLSMSNSNVSGGANTASGSTDKKADTDSNAAGGQASTDEWAFWVMLGTALNAFAAIVLAIVSIYQSIQMKRTKEEAAHQVRKMQGQLRVMKKQTGLTQKTVIQTARIVKQNEKMVKATQGQLTSMQGQEKTMQGQLVAMERQENTMREQLKEMRRQIRVSDIQFETQLEFTQIGITTAEKTAIYAQRAYVTAKIRGTGEGSHQWRLRIENTGSTPANNVCVSYAYEFRETPPWDWDKTPFTELPEKQIVFESYFTKVERLGVIAPNSSYHIIRTPKVDPLTPEQHKQWRAEELRFFCWGSITYEDIFNEKRHTEFCFFESQRHPNGYPCEHGNEAY